MRSGPASLGLSIRMGMPLRTPGPISSVCTARALSPTPLQAAASTGTVDETNNVRKPDPANLPELPELTGAPGATATAATGVARTTGGASASW